MLSKTFLHLYSRFPSSQPPSKLPTRPAEKAPRPKILRYKRFIEVPSYLSTGRHPAQARSRKNICCTPHPEFIYF